MRRVILLMLFVLTPVSAAAQDGWEIEFHAGGMVGNHPAGGDTALPGAGTPFTTTTGRSSRRESSWFYGDGAVLVNQANTARGLSAAIAPLDAILTSAVAQRQTGGTFGVRIARRITARYSAEFALDYGRTPTMLSDAAMIAIEASRASFASALSMPLPAGPQGAAPIMTATATATFDRERGSQLFTGGAININLTTAGRFTPYASLGAGVVTARGDMPSVALVGNYRIAGPPGTPMAGVVVHDETDRVTLRYSVDRHQPVALVGGGVKYALSPRWGVRLDVRAHLGRNPFGNLVDAAPTIKTLTPATVLVLPANPSLQFSNNASTGAQSSLDASSTSTIQTFRGSGTQVQTSVVSGIYWRF